MRILQRRFAYIIVLMILLFIYSVAESQVPRIGLTTAWSPDGTMLAIGGSDPNLTTGTGFIEIWDQDVDTVLDEVSNIDGGVFSIVWSPDSRMIAETGSSGVIDIRSVNNLDNPIATFTGFIDQVTGISWSPNGDVLASVTVNDPITLKIWDMTTMINQPLLEQVTQSGNAVAWSSDGQYIAIAGLIGLSLFEVSVLPSINPNDYLLGPSTAMFSVAWNSDNTRIATGDIDGNIYIYEQNGFDYTLSQTFVAHTEFVDAIAWSPDGSLLASASNDGTIKVFETTNFNEIDNYSRIQGYTINSISWFPDSSFYQLAYPDQADTPIIVEPSVPDDAG